MSTRRHKLLTKELIRKLPGLYATDGVPLPEKVAVVKLFHAYGSGTWYLFEYDPEERRAFGYVTGLGHPEMGYVSLDELESARFRGVVPAIERDKWWAPRPMSEVLSTPGAA